MRRRAAFAVALACALAATGASAAEVRLRNGMAWPRGASLPMFKALAPGAECRDWPDGAQLCTTDSPPRDWGLGLAGRYATYRFGPAGLDVVRVMIGPEVYDALAARNRAIYGAPAARSGNADVAVMDSLAWRDGDDQVVLERMKAPIGHGFAPIDARFIEVSRAPAAPAGKGSHQ